MVQLIDTDQNLTTANGQLQTISIQSCVFFSHNHAVKVLESK